MKYWICAVVLMISGIVRAQNDTKIPDTVERKLLQEVVIQAYEQNRKLADVAAAV